MTDGWDEPDVYDYDPDPCDGPAFDRAYRQMYEDARAELAAEARDRRLTVKEVAARLGVDEATIYREAAAGRLPHYRIGRALRFEWSKVRKVVEREVRDGPDHRVPRRQGGDLRGPRLVPRAQDRAHAYPDVEQSVPIRFLANTTSSR